jgi:hypothetical protein
MTRTQLIEKCLAAVKEVTIVASEFQNLDLAILNLKEHPRGWSILQCFDHLNLYNDYYVKQITKAFEDLKTSHQDEISYSWIGKKSINMMAPQNLSKQKTFRHMEPSHSQLDKSVIEKFLTDQSQLRGMLLDAKTRGLNLNHKIIKVEFFKLLKMYTGETFEFMINHELRHILQARRIQKNISAQAALIV